MKGLLQRFCGPPQVRSVGAILLHNKGLGGPARFPFAEGGWNKFHGFRVHRPRAPFLAPQPVALRFHTRSRLLSSYSPTQWHQGLSKTCATPSPMKKLWFFW